MTHDKPLCGWKKTPPTFRLPPVMMELVTDADDLKTLCVAVHEAPWVGLDTEFLRERTYFARLCLIQIALPDRTYAVDPLALDIHPLAAAVSGPGMKILHAGRQDLELLLQETGALPAPLFDTQIAAALLGHDDQIGYGALVKERLGVVLAKDATRTDWTLRPLSARQLAYAHDDVHYLGALYEGLAEALARQDRLSWLREECEALSDPDLYRPDGWQLTRRYRQGAGLSARAQAIFENLLLWREEAARTADLPRTWVVSDAHLLELAQNPPVSEAELGSRLTARAASRFAAGLFAAIGASPQTPLRAWAANKLPPDQEARFARLCALVDARAQALGIKPGVLASRRVLRDVAQGAPADALARGWRALVLGPEGREILTHCARPRAASG